MNTSRTISLAFSYKDLVEALKAKYPGSIHVQGIPDVGSNAVAITTSAGRGIGLQYTTNIPSGE